jgi:hypothetical protein
MAPMKMSWHTEDGRLASYWVESEAIQSYNPVWMQSLYPCEASPNQSSALSPFGKPGWYYLTTRACFREN